MPNSPFKDLMQDNSIPQQLKAVTELLEWISNDLDLLQTLSVEERIRLVKAAGNLYCPDIQARRRLTKRKIRAQQVERSHLREQVLDKTGIRTLRQKPIFATPNPLSPPSSETLQVIDPQNCYICKKDFSSIHHFYDQLCSDCADFNFQKRTELADLNGRVALLTGGRVKIGYQAGLKLLRAGAHLIVTTRFPRESVQRYSKEADFLEWQDRLEIFGLDLRHTPSVESFCNHLLQTRDRLDFIVNNACQTVRRPPQFYAHMMERERASVSNIPSSIDNLLGKYQGSSGENLVSLRGLNHSAQLSQIPLFADELISQTNLFPEGQFDRDLQQLDLREINSWRLLMAEVSTVELLEVQLVNAIAPFIINARLKPLMFRVPGNDKHIVNVSAVEGQFYRSFKTTRHPHTNMAKAALNMMTRTSATDYHNDGIHMNSVDTGWVTDEDPAELAEKKILEHRFHPPLDIVDGAARIVDPIMSGINTGNHIWGKFLKDYKPTDW